MIEFWYHVTTNHYDIQPIKVWKIDNKWIHFVQRKAKRCGNFAKGGMTNFYFPSIDEARQFLINRIDTAVKAKIAEVKHLAEIKTKLLNN